MSEKQFLQFGEFTLCPDEKTLHRGDENIAITPKMYDLLIVLVENADRVVDKELLLKTVWPDSFVEEGNITYNIRQLRKVLGDDAQSPSYIETIPKRGYRFVAKVSRSSNGDSSIAPDSSAVAKLNDQKSGRFRPIFVISVTAFALLILAMAAIAWFSRGTISTAAPILSAPFVAEKLSTDGQVFQASISPDGRVLVYSHRNGGKQSLWIRQLETQNNIQIVPPTETFYGGLEVSPDGNYVYFSRGLIPRPGRQIDIYRVPIVGGSPQKVVEETQGWLSVSPDGQKISFVRCPYADDEYCSLWIADAADGKNEKKLIATPRPIRISDNKISPDGKSIAYAVGQSRTGSNEFELSSINIDSGEQHKFTQQKFFNINYLDWLPDQSGMLLTARNLPDRNFRIWHISQTTGKALALTDDSETYFRLSLNEKANLLVSTRVEPDFHLNIYRTDQPNDAPTTLANASTVTYAANGKIVFSSIMTGDQEIWSINPDGSDQRQLTNDPADEIAPIVSPDNRTIFYESNRSGEIRIWRMDLDGSNQRQVTNTEGGFPLMVSPDERWLYYRSGFHNTLRRVSAEDGKEEMVYDPSGSEFAISPDCTKLAVAENKGGANRFTIISLSDGHMERTFASPDPEASPVYLIWSRDGGTLNYVLADDNSESRSLWSQPLDADRPRLVVQLHAGDIFELSGLAFSPDGKTLAAVQGTWNHDAVLIRGLKASR